MFVTSLEFTTKIFFLNSEIRDKHESALKQLFYLMSKPDNTEAYTELIQDISEVDQVQLQNYLQTHKLGEKDWEVDKRLVVYF